MVQMLALVQQLMALPTDLLPLVKLRPPRATTCSSAY